MICLKDTKSDLPNTWPCNLAFVEAFAAFRESLLPLFPISVQQLPRKIIISVKSLYTEQQRFAFLFRLLDYLITLRGKGGNSVLCKMMLRYPRK